MTVNDDWLAAAFSDTDLVAEVLITLRTPPPPPPSKRQTPAWTIHQRRSRTQPSIQASATKSEPPRASPSTPLSWSAAAASVSGGGVVISRSNKVCKTTTSIVICQLIVCCRRCVCQYVCSFASCVFFNTVTLFDRFTLHNTYNLQSSHAIFWLFSITDLCWPIWLLFTSNFIQLVICSSRWLFHFYVF